MKTPLPLPSQEYLQYHFYYNPKTGKFYRRFANIGFPIGYTCKPDSNGYIKQRVKQVLYRTNRLIWMYMTGEDPGTKLRVDHKDRNRSNNRWSNLRLADSIQNNENRTARGYTYHQGKYRAKIVIGGKPKTLGYFDTPEEARAAYLKAKEELHPFYAA